MELTESIELLNQQLIDLFGIDTVNGLPIWRIVWSEDQFEKRLMETTDKGIFLLKPEVREVPKYRQWIIKKYVLEQLVVVPEINQSDLPTSKISYEPIFVYETGNGGYLPPRLDVSKFIIDTIYSVKGKTSLAKYKDPSTEEEIELRNTEINKMVEYLSQDESDTADALHLGEGIVVPNSYTTNSLKKDN